MRSELIEGGPLIVPSDAGRLRRAVLTRLLRSGLAKRRRLRRLFWRNLAYKFRTDDGRVCLVPVSRELLEDAAFDVETHARQMALTSLEGL